MIIIRKPSLIEQVILLTYSAEDAHCAMCLFRPYERMADLVET